MNGERGRGATPPRNRTAMGLMLGYALSMSFVPLFVAYGAKDSPFIFNAAYAVGSVAGFALILLSSFRGMAFSGDAWKAIRSRTFSALTLWWVAASFGMPLYAWSAQLIEIAVATALYETWPIFLVVFTGWLFRVEARYRKITAKTLSMFGIALGGIISVIASQAGGYGAFVSADAGGGAANLAAGVALALGAVFLVALDACGFRWSADLASELSRRHDEPRDRLELFGVVAGTIIQTSVSLPAIASIGVWRNEPLSADAMIYGALGGSLLGAGGSVLWRKANLIASDLGINAVGYFTPALALGWLFAFSQVGEIGVGYLLFGVAAIIVANLGMYIETRGESQESAEASAQTANRIDAGR